MEQQFLKQRPSPHLLHQPFLGRYNDTIKHPICSTHIPKRIPKGARPAAANMLQKLNRDLLHNPLSTNSWSRLFGFSTACLAKPSRGGKSHNLTTNIVKQIRQYEVGSVSALEVPRQSSTQSKKSKSTYIHVTSR
jgi:hypothetical protein